MLKQLVLILCALVLLAIAAFPVHAVSLSVSGIPDVQTCPTVIGGENPLNKYDMPVFITNAHSAGDTYLLDLQLPAGWHGFAALDGSLGVGETRQVDAIWVTVPNVPAGTYPVKLLVESRTTHDTAEVLFNIDVLSCYAVSVTAEPSYKKACTETDNSVSYSIRIKNTGKGSETFQLEAFQNGLNVPYASFSQSPVIVPAGGEMAVTLTLTPPQDLSGVQAITVEAKSGISTADAEIQLDIGSCFGFDTSVTPQERTLCLGKTATLSLLIENRGETDTFRLLTPEWVVPDTTYISLPNGQKHKVTLTLSPEKVGDQPLDVTVKSERTGLSERISATAIVESCKDLAVIISPAEKSVCSNIPASFTVSVKNTGAVQDTVELTSTKGALGQSKVVLEPGETKDIRLDIDTEGLIGEELIKIIARSDGASDETTGRLVAENCYSASLLIEPAERTTCPCGTLGYSIVLENDGKLKDTYTIKFGNTTETASLEPGEKTEFGYMFLLPCDMKGKYEIRASVSSGHTEGSAASSLTVKESGTCWSGSLEAGKSAEVEVYGAAVMPVKVKNTGDYPVSYALSLEGPSWVYMEPDAMYLQPGSDGNAYIYASPPHGTDIGEYKVTIRADSDRSTISSELAISVVEEADAGTGDGSDVTLNASYETGDSVTGMFTVAVPAWKTILVGLITLLVITILVVKFAGFVKT